MMILLGISLHAEVKTANGKYTATAYNQTGLTASGVYTQRHIVAADPAILPIGSRIKIKHAGRYTGEYVVADTGEKIEGRRLDIYIPSQKACRRFGKKQVRVRVIQLGDGTHETTTQAAHEVTKDVKQDLAKKVVGNAATEDDWAAHRNSEQKPVDAPTPSDAAPAKTGSSTPGTDSSAVK